MKSSLLVLSLLVSAPVVVRGQAPMPHRWQQILETPGEVVDIDTANVQRRDGYLVAWLRWDLDRNSHQFGAEYRLEQVELDCRALRVRLLALEIVEADNAVKVTAVQLESADMQWHQYSKGSLGAQSVSAACRRLTGA